MHGKKIIYKISKYFQQQKIVKASEIYKFA